MENISLNHNDIIMKNDYDDNIILDYNNNMHISVNDICLFVLENLDAFENEGDIVCRIKERFNVFGMSDEELERETADFIFKMICEGVVKCDKPIIYQPYYYHDYKGMKALYFPYLRKIIVVTNALFDIVRKITARNFRDVKQLDFFEDIADIEVLLKIVDFPFSVDDAESYYIDIPRRVVLLPTTACNLRCNYCYAWRENKKIEKMSFNMASAAIDYVFENAVKANKPSVDISFMGGGEPTCNWDVLVGSVEYARKLASRYGVKSSVTLTTNGVIDAEKAQWIARNIDHVKISFDGVEEVQNKQRPAAQGDSFVKASKTMEILTQSESDFLVRITVTNSSIEYLEKSVKYVLSRFKPSSIIINPVYVCGSCASHGVGSIEYKYMCNVFRVVEDLGISYGVDVVCPYDKVTYMDIPKLPYCGYQKGNCFITPSGYVSACSEIDSIEDPRSNIFFFGYWDENQKKYYINDEKMAQLHFISRASNERCSECSNNAFCPGTCLVRKINAEDLKRIIELQGQKEAWQSFSEEQMDVLIKSNHSNESVIQCEMTAILTDLQIDRIIEENIELNRTSLNIGTEAIEVKSKTPQNMMIFDLKVD